MLLAVFVVWLTPTAIAMVPGPTEEDDKAPVTKTETPSMAVPEMAPQINLPMPSIISRRHYAQCMSIGLPNEGALRGGVLFPRENPYYLANRADHQYASPETIDALLYAAAKVNRKFGRTPKLVLGDLSALHGGKLRRHMSHQSGRDADVGFYFKNGSPGYLADFNPKNFDVRRNWAYIEALLEINAIEFIFLDTSVQKMLYDYAKNRLRLPPSYLEKVFQYPRKNGERIGIIRHARGHKNHYHVRFYSPIAVANAMRARFKDTRLAKLQQSMHGYVMADIGPVSHKSATSAKPLIVPTMVRQPSPAPPGSRRIVYSVHSGDSLWSIARKHRTTVSRIREWNSLASSQRLHVGQKLLIYVKN